MITAEHTVIRILIKALSDAYLTEIIGIDLAETPTGIFPKVHYKNVRIAKMLFDRLSDRLHLVCLMVVGFDLDVEKDTPEHDEAIATFARSAGDYFCHLVQSRLYAVLGPSRKGEIETVSIALTSLLFPSWGEERKEDV